METNGYKDKYIEEKFLHLEKKLDEFITTYTSHDDDKEKRLRYLEKGLYVISGIATIIAIIISTAVRILFK